MVNMKLSTLANFRQRISGWKNHWRVVQLARQVATHSQPDPSHKPVAFFNASARLTGLSQNAAFALLTSWGLRLAGISVSNFVCQSGMSHCVLGTNRQNYKKPSPCRACLRQSRRIYTHSDVYWFEYKWSSDLVDALKDLNVDELSNFEYHKVKGPLITPGLSVPLGRLVLPSIRWALRCHTLPDNEGTRYLLREYILSAYNIAQEFSAFLDEVKPATVVIFNGMMFPEATALWVAQARGLRVITYEVGFQQYSAFFTEGEATAYPIHIPKDFKLSPNQSSRLDDYLEKRFQGQFTMAGIRFWPEMHGLSEDFLSKASQFQQMVPIFTNVVYDSSQVHANRIFPHMFAWLDLVLELIRSHPETLFVLRAHPDEMRPGTAKQSRESVREWVKKNKVDSLPNVSFIDSQDFISSYELVRRSKFVMVYNSSIGLESTLLGKPAMSGGKARYTQYPIVFFPESPQAYQEMAEKFFAEERIELPEEFQRNARRFLYYQLFRSSLSFEKFLQEGHRKGYVFLRPFTWEDLLPGNSSTMRIMVESINSTAPHPQADPLNKGNNKVQLFLADDVFEDHCH
jgi:hypothetical protein